MNWLDVLSIAILAFFLGVEIGASARRRVILPGRKVCRGMNNYWWN